jgi:hypothetical protein
MAAWRSTTDRSLVVVGHRSGPALLHGQTRLGAVERLDLALLVDGQDDGVLRRVDIKTDHIAQFFDKLGIGGELELPDPMGLQPMRAPDTLQLTDTDATSLRHHGSGPMCRLSRRVGQRQCHDALGDFRSK